MKHWEFSTQFLGPNTRINVHMWKSGDLFGCDSVKVALDTCEFRLLEKKCFLFRYCSISNRLVCSCEDYSHRSATGPPAPGSKLCQTLFIAGSCGVGCTKPCNFGVKWKKWAKDYNLHGFVSPPLKNIILIYIYTYICAKSCQACTQNIPFNHFQLSKLRSEKPYCDSRSFQHKLSVEQNVCHFPARDQPREKEKTSFGNFLSPLRSKPGKMPKHAHSASKKHNCISALSPHKFKVKKWEETKTVPQCRSCSAFKPTLRFTCINGDPSAKADLVAGPWNDTLLVSTYGCRQIFRSVGLMYILPPATLESNVFGIIKRFWQSGNPFMGLSLFSSPTSGLLWAS